MRISLTALLFLALGFVHPVSVSFSALAEDVEGSGYELGSSGSGDWSEQGETSDVKVSPNTKDLTTETTHWPVFLETNKSFLENKQIFDAVIAGGVTGVILAAILSALIIYKWQGKNDRGHVIG